MSEWGRIGTREILYVAHSALPVEGWQRIGTRQILYISHIEAPAEGWHRIGIKESLHISKPVISPPPPPPPEPEEKKFPWVPVLIGGGGLIAIIGLAATARK